MNDSQLLKVSEMSRKEIKDWFSWYAPVLALTAVIIGILTRIILILNPVTVTGFGLGTWVKIFTLGAVNDLAFAAIALLPAFLVYSFLGRWKYGKPAGWILWAVLLAATLYFVFCNDISDEYGGPLPMIVNAVISLIFICFSLKWFIPSIRDGWRRAAMHATMFIYAFLMVANVASEYTFWDEFGVRYNFIAVDYLVYTNEVIGNIMESYNIPLMVSGALLAGALLYWLMTRGASLRAAGVSSLKRWFINFCISAVSALAGGMWLHYDYRSLGSDDAFATQLQQNGCWDFLEAFNSNELDYNQFYATIPDAEAVGIQRSLCNMDSTGARQIVRDGEELHKNIILITIESLSGDFLSRYGCDRGITPNIDSLARESLVFDNLFATGNRTVRGLEAVTLCIPPSSGESIVKRKDCGGRFSTGSVLREKGYVTRYIYGGDSYFDNMGAFFGGNGYEVVDRSEYLPGEVTFANIWGTCDEDSYNVALRLCDADHAAGRPFFNHIMTISNHRPYTYPEGRISYDGNPMSRRAAVKYTDYALGKFISDASRRPWFANTVFVVVADHCASSAGKTSLPLDCYHIPAFIYSPGLIAPQAVEKVCSQIDLMPTLFSLLNFSYGSRFYGQDILSPGFRERAFMATYQDLGYYADGILTVLSPVRKVQQFAITRHEGWKYTEDLLEDTVQPALTESVAYYQCANLGL